MLTFRSLLVGTTLGLFTACGGPTAQAVPDDAAKAAAAAKEADGCSAPKDCYNKAALALQAKDNVKAMKFLPGACDHDSKACVIAAEILAQGKGLPVDLPKAADFYKRGCDGGILVACANEASMRYSGEGGVTVDKPRARALFEKTCGPEMLDNCNNAATMLLSGDGGPEDKAKARSLFDMACSGAYLQACVAGGAMYLGGQGGAEDKGKAKAHFEKACDGKNADGCFNLGVLYGSGNGVTKDIDKSQQFFQKACEMGSKKSCETLDQIKADIEKAKAPPPKAVKGKK